MKNELMKGFSTPAEHQVTLGNWRRPPFNKWAFKHVREIIPSAEIPNDPDNVSAVAERVVRFRRPVDKGRRWGVWTGCVPSRDRYRRIGRDARRQNCLRILR